MEPVTIILVEDEGLLLLEFETALTEGGFDVASFSSSAKAVTYLNSEQNTAMGLITDIRLSSEEPDGWEIARTARELDPDIAVVYVSGHGAADWPAMGVPNSIMLEKPFAMPQLMTAISQLLNDRASSASE
ncbi:response regulator [Sinorhizobium meliloti]|uniref:Response regulator n=1 Tax=Rhizobium meliloti TaxID=382 RepID=A0AAW9TX45_RHIML|nr:response regulator [Sinorhizobium meliloti]MQW36752.1 response regulator [Sinorhizobium meliloti]